MGNCYPQKIFVDNAENVILQLYIEEQMFLYTRGDKFMGKQLIKKCDEFCETMRKQDEALLRLLKQGHRKLIVKIITDYLQQPES